MLEIILFCTCIFLFQLYYRTVVDKGPPIYKGRWPILGHAHLLLKCTTHEQLMDLFNTFSEESEKLGGVMRWYFGPTQFYWITDPDDTFKIGKISLTKHIFYEFADNFIGSGIVASSGSIWKRERKLLNPAFSWKVLSTNPATINMKTRKHLTHFDSKVGKGPVDLFTDIKLMTLNIVLATLFTSFENDGRNLNEIYLKNLDDSLDIVITRMQTIFYHPNFIYKFSKLKKQEEVVMKIVDKCVDEMIRKKREINQSETYKNTSASRNKMFLDLLLELYDEGKLTMKTVKDEINTFVIAAFDTTSCAINNILVFLGTHLDVQDKVVNELTKVLGTEDRDVDKQDLHKLVYLEAVIMEYLRLHPPSPLSFRTFEETIYLSKYTIPAGSHCVLAYNGVNRDRWWGQDRNAFRPERWFERHDLHNYFAGFGVGRRICIGKVHAMMSMKTVLAHLVRRYRIAANASKLRFKFDFVMKPVAGHHISIEKRI